VSSTREVLTEKQEMNPARHNSQREIAAFLQAISTYPEHFQENPLLSFQQHMVQIADENHQLPSHASSR
jgi:hypothetical protein